MSLRHSRFVLKMADPRNKLRENRETRLNQYKYRFYETMISNYKVERQQFQTLILSNFDKFRTQVDCNCVICWYRSLTYYLSTNFKFLKYLDQICINCNYVHLMFRMDFKIVFHRPINLNVMEVIVVQ